MDSTQVRAIIDFLSPVVLLKGSADASPINKTIAL
jgi:hypothetical protein